MRPTSMKQATLTAILGILLLAGDLLAAPKRVAAAAPAVPAAPSRTDGPAPVTVIHVVHRRHRHHRRRRHRHHAHRNRHLRAMHHIHAVPPSTVAPAHVTHSDPTFHPTAPRTIVLH